MDALDEGYHAARHEAAWIERTGQVRLMVSGPDRVKFLNNLTTNDVKRLTIWQGCEAFVTSPQGKTLAFVTMHVFDEEILLRTSAVALETLGPHFQKYSIFDDVKVTDITASTAEIYLASQSPPPLLGLPRRESLPMATLALHHSTIGQWDVRLIKEPLTGQEGYTIILDAPMAAEFAKFCLFSFAPMSANEFEALRIEAGTPIFGVDITPDNLPQEIGRDAQSINFVKGCYLGQETVARIDALGHVNKVLKGLRLPGDRVPPRGTSLEADGKVVGQITSAAYSPGWDCVVCLAYVRMSHAQAGREVTIALERSPAAIVADLPMLPH
jgi:folate-binding protein YgfZ